MPTVAEKASARATVAGEMTVLQPEAPIGGARAVREGKSGRIPGEGVARIGDGAGWRFRVFPEGGEGLGGGSRAFQSWRRV